MKAKTKLLRELLESVDISNRQEAIAKYASFLAIISTLENQFYALSQETPQNGARKAWKDTVNCHTHFLEALKGEFEGDSGPERYLKIAGQYLVKVSAHAASFDTSLENG